MIIPPRKMTNNARLTSSRPCSLTHLPMFPPECASYYHRGDPAPELSPLSLSVKANRNVDQKYQQHREQRTAGCEPGVTSRGNIEDERGCPHAQERDACQGHFGDPVRTG